MPGSRRCDVVAGGYPVAMTIKMKRGGRLALAGVAVLSFALAGCSDEDGDGATTDEEIQDVEDGVGNAGDEVEEEIDGQDQGSNEDNE